MSSSCFQVKSSTTLAPKVSNVVSVRFGMARMAPLGRSRSFRYMLSGLVKMCRSMVMGSMIKKAAKATTCRIQVIWCHRVSVSGLSPVKSRLSG